MFVSLFLVVLNLHTLYSYVRLNNKKTSKKEEQKNRVSKESKEHKIKQQTNIVLLLGFTLHLPTYCHQFNNSLPCMISCSLHSSSQCAITSLVLSLSSHLLVCSVRDVAVMFAYCFGHIGYFAFFFRSCLAYHITIYGSA